MARILVVDDEKRMVELLTGSLRHHGHDVTGLTKGGEVPVAIGGNQTL